MHLPPLQPGAAAPAPPAQPASQPAVPPALRARAEELEAAFLAEMLGHAGVGESTGAFGGGAGETQFASFLVEAQARAMVRAGGIGLTQTLIAALAERADVRG